MSDLSRRNFLFGTVAAAAAGTGILLRSPNEAIELFRPTLEETIAISRVPRPDPRQTADPWGLGDMLYAADGTPVLYVREYTITAQVDSLIESTIFGDMHKFFVERGMRRYQLKLRGLPTGAFYKGR